MSTNCTIPNVTLPSDNLLSSSSKVEAILNPFIDIILTDLGKLFKGFRHSYKIVCFDIFKMLTFFSLFFSFFNLVALMGLASMIYVIRQYKLYNSKFPLFNFTYISIYCKLNYLNS